MSERTMMQDSRGLALLQEAAIDHYTPLEYRACQIALTYEKLRREFFDEPYTCLNRENSRKSRCFPHFYKLAEMENDRRDLFPDMTMYLRAQFEMNRRRSGTLMNDVPIAPNQLHMDSSLIRYRDYVRTLVPAETYHRSNKPRVEEKTIKRALGRTAVFLARMNKDYFEPGPINYLRLMSYTMEGDYQPLFFLFIVQNYISRYFLAASKTYPTWRLSLDSSYQEELPYDLDPYIEALRSCPGAIEYGRQAFGDEFAL